MARIAGVDIPKNKQVLFSLQYIYGIGPSLSQKILAQAKVDPYTRVSDLAEEEVNRLREIIDHEHNVEGELRKEVDLNIKRLILSARKANSMNVMIFLLPIISLML